MFNVPELRDRLYDAMTEDRSSIQIHNVMEHIDAVNHDVDLVMQVIEKWLLESFNRGDHNG